MNDQPNTISLAVELTHEQAQALGFLLQHLPLPHIDAIARTESEAAAMLDAASVVLDALAVLAMIAGNRAARERRGKA
jgi:hypothetical protein